MAGHSKWAQIKRKKAVTDARRGQHFTKLIREITVAAREGGGDPDANPRLRLAVDTAKAANMPNDNIERAILKGTGELEGVAYEEVTYEGYGPNGVALFIECVTDNSNRAVADVRHVLAKRGGSLGTSGSVAWQFDRKGQIWIRADHHEEDATMLAALEAGAEDMERQDDQYLVTTAFESFHTVQDGLRAAGITIAEAELAMVPKTTVALDGEAARKLVGIIDALDELDDVQHVHTNADLDEAALAETA
ncbi:MAG: YebC/PmpR family DNA-binding transcriptional regulator [Gemmatimonadota bacterium]